MVKPHTVAVAVCTYGDREKWDELANRAIASVQAQTRQPNEILRIHKDTLNKARNAALAASLSTYIIFLDADDELDPRYIECMLATGGDIRQPSTLGIVDGVEDDYPVLIPSKPLFEGNYIVIGAMINRSLALQVDGFRDLPQFEDWDLWCRMVMAGGTIGQSPAAVYRIHVRQDSRNQNNDALFHQLKREYLTMPGVERIYE